MKKRFYLRLGWLPIFFGLFMIGPSGCGHKNAVKSLKPLVYVSIIPQSYFVEKIAGDRIDVEILVQPGQSPHVFEPSPQQMTQMAKAKMYFMIGLPFEKQLIEKFQANYKNLLLTDTAEGIQKRLMEAHDHKEEGVSTAAGEADESGLDPHIWLSFPLIKIQSKHILEGLEQIDPAHQEEFQKRFEAFMQEIDQTDGKIKEILAPLKNQAFYVFHPAFGYFAADYNMTEKAVEMSGKSPTPKELRDLIEKAKTDRVKVLFVQPQFDSKSAEAIAQAIGGHVSSFDPLEKDVLKNLEIIAKKIQSAYPQ